MFQYIWVVIIISNALLFNGNDWFKTFVWPLHPLVCFTLSSASPFHAANNAYNDNHTCLGPHREKQTTPGKLKKNLSKTKNTFERMFGLDSKDCFFLFSLVFLVLKWKKQKTHCVLFFEGLRSIKVSKKINLGKPKNPLSQKQTFSQKYCFLVLLEFFVFFVCLLIHMIAICVLMLAYLIGPGKSNFDQSFSLKSLSTMWD